MTVMCSLPYWRKNLWNGAACKPALMILENGGLRAWDYNAVQLFDSPVAAVTVKLAKTGTLQLGGGGRKWAFVGRGAQISAQPSGEQREMVTEFWLAHQGMEPAVINGPGFLDTLINGSSAWHMTLWRDLLMEAGAQKG